MTKRNPNKSHPGHRNRWTHDQIVGSNVLRLKAQSTGWTATEIAAICKCHPDTIKKWMTGDQLLNPERQELLDAHWNGKSA